MTRPNLRSRATAVAIGAALALGLTACGGDTVTTTVSAGSESESEVATAEADTAAIEDLMVEFGASVGADACDFYSIDFLAEQGGLERCERSSADSAAFAFTVDEVSIDGDTASATVSFDEGDPATYPLARSGEPNDAYDGWTIDGRFEEVPGAAATSEAPETTAEEEPVEPEKLSTVEKAAARAAAYASCIQARGAEDIGQERISRDLPVVTFSAGAFDLVAFFAGSPTGAENTLVYLEGVGAGYRYTKLVGSVLLVTQNTGKADVVAGEPPRADEQLAFECLEEIGV